MYFCEKESMKTYSQCMKALKRLNSEYYELRKSKHYKKGMVLNQTMDLIKAMKWGKLIRQYKTWIRGYTNIKKYGESNVFTQDKFEESLYFSNKKIAVYTVIFGQYDTLLEPYIKPDNIDYYLITDMDVDLSNSVWNKVDISRFNIELQGLTNAQKNRFFKMMPYKVFEQYECSIYIDGNIQVVTDLTEFVNLIGPYDIATHQHFCRDCVYDECDAILNAKKDTVNNINNHKDLFVETGMPRNYGLMECNVIARNHTERVKKLMEEWWSEYLRYSNRDQLSLPHILFMNNISVFKVATLGENVFQNPAIRVVTHV